MGKLATTSSLSDYPKMTITSVKHKLGQHAKAIHLDYSFRGKPYGYDVGITTSSCHYGNYRYWFICPKCGKRVSVLYCAGLYVCRHCIGANYQTQLEQPLERVRRKKYKVGKKLYWWSGEIGKSFPMKPKGMHQKTFDRLHGYYQELEYRENLECMARFKSFCSKRGLNY